MKQKIMNELLNRAKESAQSADIKALVADLECFMKAQEKKVNGQDVQNEWVTAREKLWSTFEKVALTYGINPDTLKEDIIQSGTLEASDEETLNLIESLEEKRKRPSSRIKKLKTKV